MIDQSKYSWQKKYFRLISLGIFLIMTGLMVYVRLYLFHDRFVALTYGLPLMVCFWHRDRRLLWTMAFAFAVMSYVKAFYLMPDLDPTDSWELLQWIFQMTNIFAIAGSIHAVLMATDALRRKNLELEAANCQLKAQAEELAQQNEEIQQQSEEIQQQSEELQQQMEETERQNEELHQQGEELQVINAELNDRESMLQALLKSAATKGDGLFMLEEICKLTLTLLSPGVQCAAIVEKQDDELVVLAQSGLPSLEHNRWPYQHSLAAIAIEHERTACVHDLADRPDMIVPRTPGLVMRSSIATPIRIDTEIIGVMEVHSTQPHAWTERQFQLMEWAAMQGSLIIHIHRLRTGLENLVDERTARLQELVDELEHFSYSITHDLRAPLRAMQGFAGILLEECTDLREDHAEYLKHITESASRMDHLITDALNYTKAVRTDLQLGRVDSHQLFEGIIKSYPNLRPPEALVEIKNTLPPVLANKAGLTQCFSNLLDNAVKFVPPDRRPHVTICAEQQDGRVTFWVEDNGIGIAPEFQPYLFQMFRRASKEYAGTGIGLVLVKKTCEKMGGKVGFTSEPGKGSRFWLTLQAAPASA